MSHEPRPLRRAASRGSREALESFCRSRPRRAIFRRSFAAPTRALPAHPRGDRRHPEEGRSHDRGRHDPERRPARRATGRPSPKVNRCDRREHHDQLVGVGSECPATQAGWVPRRETCRQHPRRTLKLRHRGSRGAERSLPQHRRRLPNPALRRTQPINSIPVAHSAHR